MNSNQFTAAELNEMINDWLEKPISGGPAGLLRNRVAIAKQLASVLKQQPALVESTYSIESLETMIADHECFFNNKLGRGDVEAELANNLERNILTIAMRLRDLI